MRSLLLWEIDRVRDASARGVTVEVRTLRGLWYELIKPALARLGRLEECNWAAKLSDYLVELVERGHTSYEELRIIDGSRLRHGPGERIAVLDSVPVVRVHHPHIILFTEKDTIYGVLDGLSTMYGISVVSGSGQPSYAASENLLREIVEHPNFVPGSQIQLLALTDFDPAGYFIAQAQWRQLCKVAEVFAPARKVNGVAFTRLGLKPDQLTAEELAKNAYPPSDKGLELWMLQTGGIDGEPLGLELDALGTRRIREMFVAGIEEVIGSEKPYHRDLARALVEQCIWEKMASEVAERRDELYEQINGDKLVDELTERCPEGILATCAKNGMPWINPLRDDAEVFQAAGLIRDRFND